VCVRREDAERFIEEIRGDDPDLAKALRIEERELEAGPRFRSRSKVTSGEGRSKSAPLPRSVEYGYGIVNVC
jgi:hypothetical protein